MRTIQIVRFTYEVEYPQNLMTPWIFLIDRILPFNSNKYKFERKCPITIFVNGVDGRTQNKCVSYSCASQSDRIWQFLRKPNHFRCVLYLEMLSAHGEQIPGSLGPCLHALSTETTKKIYINSHL